MKQSILLLLCAILFPTFLNLRANDIPDNKYNTTQLSPLPPLSTEKGQGLSATMAGSYQGQLLVAGGCNFPNLPAAQNGEKVFHRSVFLLDGKQWKKIGTLPTSVAYGVSLSTENGVLCLGGTDGKAVFATTYLLSHHAGKRRIQALPAMPKALQQMGAALDERGKAYVAGGLDETGAGNQEVFTFDTRTQQWSSLGNMPGPSRVQPTVVVQNGATGPLLLILGGYDVASKRCLEYGLIYDFQTQKWRQTSPMQIAGKKIALVGATSIKSGSQFVVSIGGVNQQIFEKAIQGSAGEDYLLHAPEWYKFRTSLLIYNTITDTWIEEGQSPLLARAGASLVAHDGAWALIGGELKPGVRAVEVTQIQLKTRTSFGLANWIVLIAYLLGMIALGYYFMKREQGANDFFTGGGRIPWWAAGISIYATMLSAITYMAYPAKAYATNWTYYPMLVTILIVSFPVIKYYLPFFRRLSVTSAYEYLELRFNLALRLLASALFIVFMVARMALVLYLPSLALTAVTGIDIYVCIVLMACITIVYCTMGGVEAVVWGDVVQGFILVAGAILAVAYLIWGTDGGVQGFWNIAMQNDKLQLFDWSFSWKSATFWVVLVGGMANNLISYTSDQTVIQRYLTTKDEAAARHSILLNGGMSVVVSIVFFAIGAGLYTFFKTQPAEMDFTMAKNDIIFPFFIMSQLPAGIAGLLIAAIFAATMSTISSNINSVATAFTMDFYKRFRPSSSEHQLLRSARYSSLVSGLLGMLFALLMATWDILSLLDFFQEVLGLLSSGLGGLFLMGIFIPRIGGKAAMIGFLAGVITIFLMRSSSISFLLYGAIGMIVSVSVGYIASYIFQERLPSSQLTVQSLKDEVQ